MNKDLMFSSKTDLWSTPHIRQVRNTIYQRAAEIRRLPKFSTVSAYGSNF